MPSGDTLRFATPAHHWDEAFPLGNGRLGAMVHGGLRGARVQVNDATAWSGDPGGPARALGTLRARGAGPALLADLRAAVADGRDDEARRLAQRFQGPYAQAYQPFVDLVVDVSSCDEPDEPDEPATEADPWRRYAGRRLDLRDGVAHEAARLGGADLEITWFTSALDGCLHGRWRVAAGRFGLEARLRGAQPGGPSALVLGEPAGRAGAQVRLELPADVAPGHEPGRPARTSSGPAPTLVGYATVLVATDGRASGTPGHVSVTGASWVELVLATATTSRWPEPGPLGHAAEAERECRARAQAALPTSPDAGDLALRRHVEDHRALADATRLELGPPVDLLLPDALERATLGERSQAAFAFGRYLLMAASRPGAPPVNLQGVWNDEPQPPWSSAYTLNINLQMAYWPAEPTGLGACVAPLVDLVRVLAREGEAVARELYGCVGWVAHHNSDVWGWALPVGGGHGDPAWASWWMGGAWLCRHLWDRYEYTLDEEVLRDVWPLLRGAAAFVLDWLVEVDGVLVPSPSSSPENMRVRDGREAALCAGSTVDVALARDLLSHCLEAVDVLGVDEPLAPRWLDAVSRLPRPQVGADGLLREWPDGAPAVDPHHRHLSHLVGLYPLDELVDDPWDLTEAARASLDSRGPGSTGWSMAWKAALRARLGDGSAVGEALAEALTAAGPEGGPWAGGLLPNLFSTHPPFQVDGNLGLVAAMAEALLCSSRTRLHVLPALPPGWPDGEIRGLRARGRLGVDLRWASGRLVELVLRPGADGEREVVADGVHRRVLLRAGTVVRLGAGLVDRAA
ncbi:glycoside hydrolase N-terminal domain-containing protein [Cellulomonas sp. DKR-3]|uniref:Glycoside hydrolase N-terminal domain-containing protein n=1 Tax=Cellulomonas fulva TaxID=2835530 RepID=A0ABS5TU58_9CELL|nr:glycoside hydrolase N-terminal domain-containing protein [Cellulomonas fulva]MBT0992685.1 glycoside hydrolase N-terminal domain-containing protein [Cellulomonas fulva]